MSSCTAPWESSFFIIITISSEVSVVSMSLTLAYLTLSISNITGSDVADREKVLNERVEKVAIPLQEELQNLH